LHLSNGREYEVPHPEFNLVAQHSVAVADKAARLFGKASMTTIDGNCDVKKVGNK
jgi:hypothetical protein